MKKKRMFAILLAGILTLATFAGCGSNSTATPTASSSAEKTAVIHIYQDKYEIDQALKNACDAYTKLHPNVTFNVESSSSGDFYTQLKTMFTGGQGPDIFSTKGSDDLASMAEYMEDLSNESWVKNLSDAAKQAGTSDGKVYGFPISLESYGYVYNKDLFTKAGITKVPSTLSELRDACEKLKAIGVTPISSNYSEWYQSGMFKFSAAISREADPMTFIKGLNDGSKSLAGDKEMANLAAWIDIEKQYSLSPLNTDFNAEVSNFATGKCAIMLGGSWSQPALNAIDPNLNVGLFGLPMSDNASETKIFTSCSPFWSVNKNSQYTEECKAFLSWLATDTQGQDYLGTQFGLIPGFTNIKVDAKSIGPLGTATQDCMSAGTTYGIYSSYFPDGAAEQIGNTVNKYCAGKLTADEFGTELQSDWKAATK